MFLSCRQEMNDYLIYIRMLHITTRIQLVSPRTEVELESENDGMLAPMQYDLGNEEAR